MRDIFICNTSKGMVEVISLDSFKLEKSIKLNEFGENDGPHGICVSEDKLFTANNYSNTISLIDLSRKEHVKNIYIGAHCNDLKIYNNNAYVVCGDSNSLVIFNMNKMEIVEVIPCGIYPHSIDICKVNGMMVVTNFIDNSLTIVDLNDTKKFKKTRIGPNPTKAVFSYDGNYIYTCESNMEKSRDGSISILSSKNLTIIDRIAVGKIPIDFYYDGKSVIVSNFSEGVLRIVDILRFKETKRIIVGGMPKAIMKYNDEIYFCDYMTNSLIKIKKDKEALPINGELNGIIIA